MVLSQTNKQIIWWEGTGKGMQMGVGWEIIYKKHNLDLSIATICVVELATYVRTTN